ncbi:hypothetical protein RchiOBHm_Chr1g0359071 [Rosa chinensis]|uniref:Uncharacterized protein n=1 Tax=Rosa chinensis TaxID=74649 RepID=A0A2P6SIB3_ROSCH|nr:hypothetical protein RchiOBHm_Chr1g0359071 [Rosa chinensis]
MRTQLTELSVVQRTQLQPATCLRQSTSPVSELRLQAPDGDRS